MRFPIQIVALHPRRSAGVEITRTSEPNGRNRNGQSARLGFRPQNYGAVGKTLLATTMMAEFSIFQWVLPLERRSITDAERASERNSTRLQRRKAFVTIHRLLDLLFPTSTNVLRVIARHPDRPLM